MHTKLAVNVLVAVDDAVDVAVVAVFETVVDAVLEAVVDTELEPVVVAELVCVYDTEVDAVVVNVVLAHKLSSPLADFLMAVLIISRTTGHRSVY